MINTVYKVAAIQRWICGCIQISSQLEKACPVPMKLLIDEKIKGEALMEVISIQITTSSMEGGGGLHQMFGGQVQQVLGPNRYKGFGKMRGQKDLRSIMINNT